MNAKSEIATLQKDGKINPEEAKALQEDVVEAIARELRGPSAAPANPRTAAVDDDRTGSRN